MVLVRRLGLPAIFLAVVAAVYSAAFYIRGMLATVDSPEILAAAVAADLVVLVPIAYYFLVVRRFGLPVISVAGVFVLSLIAATQIIPTEQQRVLAPLEIFAGIAEVAILSFIVWKAVKGVRRFRKEAEKQGDEDAYNAIRVEARQVIDSDRVADIFAFEIAIFYYALGSWRQSLAQGAERYTSYKIIGYGSTLFGIFVLLVVELIAVHLIVQHYWSTTGAWILSVLSVYAGIWLLGDSQAQRLCPTLITNDALVLRVGMRWEVTIPFERIRSFRRISALDEKPPGTLNLVVFGDALFEVTTDLPVEARGAYGTQRTAERIWFTIDAPTEFEKALSDRLSGGESRLD